MGLTTLNWWIKLDTTSLMKLFIHAWNVKNEMIIAHLKMAPIQVVRNIRTCVIPSESKSNFISYIIAQYMSICESSVGKGNTTSKAELKFGSTTLRKFEKGQAVTMRDQHLNAESKWRRARILLCLRSLTYEVIGDNQTWTVDVDHIYLI